MNNDLIIIECPMDFAMPTRLIVNTGDDVSEMSLTNVGDDEIGGTDTVFQYFHLDGHLEINGIMLSDRQRKCLLSFLTTGETF